MIRTARGFARAIGKELATMTTGHYWAEEAAKDIGWFIYRILAPCMEGVEVCISMQEISSDPLGALEAFAFEYEGYAANGYNPYANMYLYDKVKEIRQELNQVAG